MELDLLVSCLSWFSGLVIFLSLVIQNRRSSLMHQMFSSYCCSIRHLQYSFCVAWRERGWRSYVIFLKICFTYLHQYRSLKKNFVVFIVPRILFWREEVTLCVTGVCSAYQYWDCARTGRHSMKRDFMPRNLNQHLVNCFKYLGSTFIHFMTNTSSGRVQANTGTWTRVIIQLKAFLRTLDLILQPRC